MDLKAKYGETALIAGASEGIGAAFAEGLAARLWSLPDPRNYPPRHPFSVLTPQLPVFCRTASVVIMLP